MGTAPADRAAATRVSVLTLRLTEDRITRWMLTLTTASVFDAAHNMTKVRHLRKVIRSAVLPQGEAEVLALDISEGAPFTIPNGQGARVGATAEGVKLQEMRQGLSALSFTTCGTRSSPW